VRAQFQEHFRDFGTLRRRRNELEYPSAYDAALDAAEAAEAHDNAAAIIEAAAKLLPHLQFY
jgi:hypothetical protein